MKSSYQRKVETHSESRRGSIIVLSAVMMIVLFAVVAFAIDIGYLVQIRTEFQRTADACAIAAVLRIPDQSEAISAAKSVAHQNKGKEGPELEVEDIVLGRWDRETATFTPTTTKPNAVQVDIARTAEKNGSISLFFGHMLGTDKADIDCTAIAMYDRGPCGPLIGIDWVSVPGDPTTDSYNSNLGSYDSQVPGDEGNLCSDGPIGLEGNPIVNGDAKAGRGYRTTLEGASIVTGNTQPRLRPLNLHDVDASPYEFNNDNSTLPGIQKGNNLVSPIDNQGNFLLDGGADYDLPPGTYYFNDLTLTGQSTLNITGETFIFLTGDLDTAGGYVINTTEIPENLQFLMVGGPGSTAIVTSAVDFYATVYAPQTSVELRGSADFYGVVVGKDLTVTGTGDIHYDEGLNLHPATGDWPKRVALVK
jgi:hypothetical protein